MLFTGARVNEVAQLHISDLENLHRDRNEWFWIFDFNSNECECCPPEHRKSIKNQSSHRRIPFHPSLIELGLYPIQEHSRKKGRNKIVP